MCGIIGVIGTPNAARELYGGLLTLQHRGQDSAGLLTSDETFHLYRGIGMVSQALPLEALTQLTGEMGIGHTRYATMGSGKIEETQPHAVSFPYGISMAHNGNIVNYKSLVQDLRKSKNRHLSTRTDIEVILNLFAHYLSREANGTGFEVENLFNAVWSTMQDLVGAYSVVGVISQQGLLGFRDPGGIRPLVIGKKKASFGFSYALASESATLRFLGYELMRDIEPGEAVFIPKCGEPSFRKLRDESKKSCMFEWVYFASPESQLDGIPVYAARLAFGKSMARKVLKHILDKNLNIDLVIPVPDSSRPAAIALAEALRIPYREALIKNRYVQRTFILDTQTKRESAVQLKLSPVESEIRGKNILIVDDSIVRGTTSRQIIRMLKEAGASRVYFASTCPPIKNPCYYGIDFPVREELIAFEKKISEIRDELQADELIYTDVEDLESALNTKSICTACLTGNYPTDVSEAERLTNDRIVDRKKEEDS